MISNDLDRLAEALRDLPGRTPGLDDVLALGKLILDVCFDSDPAALSSRSPKSPSLRAIMGDPRISAFGMGRRTLADYARVYSQSLDLPVAAQSLALGHRLVLLPLPVPQQHELAMQAVASGWTVRALGREIQRRRGPGRRIGARAKAKQDGTRAANVLADLRLADLTDAALKTLAGRVARVIADLVAEAERRKIDLGVALLHAAVQPTASAPAASGRRERRGDGPLVDAYRPRTFGEVVGQARAVEELRTLARVRSPLPVLLHGPSGTGKTTLARIYCRAWLCRGDRPDGCEPCNNCDTCARTAEASRHIIHGGLNEASAAATGDSQKAAEDVLEDLSLMWDGHIINEADRLLIQQKRLLARIESLPVPVVFCTTDLGKFDSEFRGRCSIVQVAAISEDEMVRFLGEIAKAEEVPVSPNQVRGMLHDIGSQRAGQVRDALVEFEKVVQLQRHQQTV